VNEPNVPLPDRTEVPMRGADEPPGFFQKPRNVRSIVVGLFIACGLLLLPDFLGYKDHVHFAQESWWGFYGFYGFLGCVALVLAAKVLRLFVMRPEDYYDE